MTAPSPEDRLYKLVEDGMCIGCGLCQAVAGPDRVQVRKVRNGELRPVATGVLDHETVDRIYDTCPGARIEGLPDRLAEGANLDLVWGPWRRMVLAWAGDPAVRHRGATGGVLTALGQYLLSSGRVDFILHARASAHQPTYGEPHLSFTPAAVLAGSRSIYGPTAPLTGLASLLDRGQPFAFIGKPCDVTALRNYAKLDARVDDLVRYSLVMVCGGYMPTADMHRFLHRIGIDPASVTGFSYRGDGCPGPTRITTADGKVHDYHYLDFWGEDESAWSLPFRCKVCADGIGEAADIAASDTWPGGSPNRVDSETDPGTNALIVRTAAGAELLDAAVADGALVVGDDVTPHFMNDVQPHQKKKKYAVRARWDGLAAEGRTVPRSARLRLDALAQVNGAEKNRETTGGTRRRVRDGKTSEERPE
jgi:coenzyme F420 hydrogenase subunit beta